MTVNRIVANIAAEDVVAIQAFYTDLFDLEVLMDLGWITTLGSGERSVAQLSFMSQGGSGAEVPDISIEVDDVDEAYDRAREMKVDIVYDLTDEPWGVRRFFLRDPVGKVVNVLSHAR